ncbi:unnamed protein product, partial [Cylicocyclus nassatus]
MASAHYTHHGFSLVLWSALAGVKRAVQRLGQAIGQPGASRLARVQAAVRIDGTTNDDDTQRQ